MMKIARRGSGAAGVSARVAYAFVGMAALALPPAAAGAEGDRERPAQRLMSLEECVRLAARENPDVRSSALARRAERYDLRVAEDEFRPHGLLAGGAGRASQAASASDTVTTSTFANASVTEALPTGGSLVLSLADRSERVRGEPDAFHDLSWTLSLSQPLLRGGGVAVGTADLRTARLQERIARLRHRSVLMGAITEAIVAYRRLVESGRRLELGQRSLDTARELLAVNRDLIAAGRMAAVDIVDSESDVANKESALVSAEDAVDAARLRLLRVLNLDSHEPLVPQPEPPAPDRVPGFEAALANALAHRPDYLRARYLRDIASIDLRVKRNERLWDLDVEGALGARLSGTSAADTWGRLGNANGLDWSFGLSLAVPIRDLTRRQGQIQAEVALETAELELDATGLQVATDVQDALRVVANGLKRVDLTRRARELAERKLAVGREKLTAGRISSFQLVSYQNDLLFAQLAELSAEIAYRNALTSLDLVEGTTLATWNLEPDEP